MAFLCIASTALPRFALMLSLTYSVDCRLSTAPCTLHTSPTKWHELAHPLQTFELAHDALDMEADQLFTSTISKARAARTDMKDDEGGVGQFRMATSVSFVEGPTKENGAAQNNPRKVLGIDMESLEGKPGLHAMIFSESMEGNKDQTYIW